MINKCNNCKNKTVNDGITCCSIDGEPLLYVKDCSYIEDVCPCCGQPSKNNKICKECI